MRSQGVSVCFIDVDNHNQTFLSEQYKIAATTMPDYQGMEGYDAVSISPLSCFFFCFVLFLLLIYIFRKLIIEKE